MKESNNRELSLKLLIVLFKANKVITDRTIKDMKSHGLTATEFMTLELLYHKGRCPLQHIGDKILITSGSITYTVDKLEAKQLLIRAKCTTDRRVIYAEITQQGIELIERIFPSHIDIIEQLMDGLTNTEKHKAIRLLKKLGLAAQQF